MADDKYSLFLFSCSIVRPKFATLNSLKKKNERDTKTPPQNYYAGGAGAAGGSGMMVQDGDNVDKNDSLENNDSIQALFHSLMEKARQNIPWSKEVEDVEEENGNNSDFRPFQGRGSSIADNHSSTEHPIIASGSTASSAKTRPSIVKRTLVLWGNGFSVDGAEESAEKFYPLEGNPQNENMLKLIQSGYFPFIN